MKNLKLSLIVDNIVFFCKTTYKTKISGNGTYVVEHTLALKN